MKNPDKFRKNINGSWYYKCNCCQQWKIETEFGCDNYCKSRHGHSTRCKQCLHVINHYDKGYKKFRNEQGNRNIKEEQKKYVEAYRKRLNADKDKALDYIIGIRWNAARKRALKKHLSFNITKEYLKELWKLQNGKCALTGLSMTCSIGNNGSNYNMSVDRIDSSKGYVKNNIQLVCNIVNTMKTNLPMEEFIHLCKLIHYGNNI